MQIVIKSRQMPITSQLRQQIERKVRRLSRVHKISMLSF
jgi:ribosome-associated translation inhibitor RaiA